MEKPRSIRRRGMRFAGIVPALVFPLKCPLAAADANIKCPPGPALNWTQSR